MAVERGRHGWFDSPLASSLTLLNCSKVWVNMPQDDEMSNPGRDRELGMNRRITRRDFLNGVSVGVGGAMLASQAKLLAALEGAALDHETISQGAKGYYPPALTGMRGSYDATYQYAHQLRDKTFWDSVPKPSEINESYDLGVGGGGISGLAAAYFYRQKAGSKARSLVLANT